MSGDAILDALIAAGLSRTARNEALSKYTSWRVGGPADYFGVAEDVKALRGSVAVARAAGIPWVMLGGGSNVLISDAGVAGLVIVNRVKTARMEESAEGAVFEGGSGLFFARAAQLTARLGFTGLEWGVAIPGTLGAGVVNNAGAHGGTVADTLIKAESLAQTGKVVIILPSDLAYSYRESRLKRSGGLVVTGSEQAITRCWFRVTQCPVEQSVATVRELMSRRQETQPIAEPSGGSTFKNPEEGAAGSLIESVGLKGHREGGAEFSHKHANFIVNTGHATASDMVQLMVLAQRAVERRHGLRLEPEIQFLGRWGDDQRVAELSASQPVGLR